MNVSLTPKLEKFVTKKVQSGSYQTSSEVVREGLRLLEEQDRRKDFSFSSHQELEEKLVEGLESGSAGKMSSKDWGALKRRVKAKVRKTRP